MRQSFLTDDNYNHRTMLAEMGGIECRVINGEAKFNYFGYDVSTDTSKDVYLTGDDGESNAVVIKQKARNFAMEGTCAGIFHYLFLKNGERCITLKVLCN